MNHQSDPDWHHWRADETVTVAEHFWKEYEAHDLASGSGQIVTNVLKGFAPFGRARFASPKVMWAKVSGLDVLEVRSSLSKYIPVIAVTGEEIHLGEEMYRSSVIRHAKDAQRLMNYSRSALSLNWWPCSPKRRTSSRQSRLPVWKRSGTRRIRKPPISAIQRR